MCFRNCGHLGMPSGRPVVVAEQVSGRLRNWTPQRPLSAAASEPRPVSGGSASGGSVSGRLVSAADASPAVGVRRYRNRSPGWRPLDGCRHCR